MSNKENVLPSRHQIGDEVILSINESQNKAKVLAVHFTVSKVKYDLEIPIYGESPTRMYNIDSCFVEK